MRLAEFVVEAATTIFGKKGNKTVRKYRCTSGSRKGRIVAKAATCTAPKNLSKSQSMKKTRRSKGSLQSVRAARTKRTNPTSIRVRSVNKARVRPKSRSKGRKKI